MDLKINFDQYFLKNGLRVLLHQDHSVPIVAVNLWYNVGSKNESPGKTGFAHLFEHMMFQGSAHVPEEMHFQLVQSAGGTLNGSTFYDRTNYFEVLPSHYLELGLWLESDRMGFLLPAMTEEKLNNQRDVVKNERRQRIDNQPYGDWLERMTELIFPKDCPYHWPVIGYMEDLDRASLQDINEFFNAFYAPSNASLVISGDFQKDTARTLVDKYFGSLPDNPTRPALTFDFSGFNLGEKRLEVFDNVQLPRIYMAYPLPGYGEQDSYVADMISDILSSGRSARFYRKLVYEQKIAQEAHAFLLPLKEVALFIVIATPQPGIPVEKLEKEIHKVTGELSSELVTEDEHWRTLNQIETRKVRELQSVATRADNLNMFATYFDNPDLINHELNRYEQISRVDIRETAQNYLGKMNRALLTYLPKSRK